MSSPVPCTPCCTAPQVVNVPGGQGLPGTNGTNGTNGATAYTLTTADFVVPVTNTNVTISVLSTAFMVIGQVLIIGQGAGAAIADPGPMTGQIVSIPSASSVQVKALGYAGDVVNGTTIGSGTGTGGAVVSPAGLQMASPLLVANGGTGSTSAEGALKNLGARFMLLGSLIGANFNTNTDQAIPMVSTKYIVRRIDVNNASINLTTAAGGFYNAGGKPAGGILVAAGQVYTALTAAAKYLDATIANVALTDVQTGASVFLSLTTPQGAPATADVYIYGDDIS